MNPHERERIMLLSCSKPSCAMHRMTIRDDITLCSCAHHARKKNVDYYPICCTTLIESVERIYVRLPKIWWELSEDCPVRGRRTPANPRRSPFVIMTFQFVLRLESMRSISSLWPGAEAKSDVIWSILAAVAAGFCDDPNSVNNFAKASNNNISINKYLFLKNSHILPSKRFACIKMTLSRKLCNAMLRTFHISASSNDLYCTSVRSGRNTASKYGSA